MLYTVPFLDPDDTKSVCPNCQGTMFYDEAICATCYGNGVITPAVCIYCGKWATRKVADRLICPRDACEQRAAVWLVATDTKSTNTSGILNLDEVDEETWVRMLEGTTPLPVGGMPCLPCFQGLPC